MTFRPRDLNVIFEGKIAQLCALVKLIIFIVGLPNFGNVYFKRYIFILCGKHFRFIDTLIKNTGTKILPKSKSIVVIHERYRHEP